MKGYIGTVIVVAVVFCLVGMFRKNRELLNEQHSLRATLDPIVITSAHELPPATVKQNYYERLNVAGTRCCIKMPVSWWIPFSYVVGDRWINPPYGLSVSNDGTISGTPLEAGEWYFWVAASDANGLTDIKMFHIRVLKG